MELEQLTKAQTVLLTLLVSFVTSIATGIVTVTLIDQAPPAVTQTINRVVEKTIETVVPAENQSASVTEVVVVKEQNLVVEAVEKTSDSLGRITRKTIDGEVFVGFGLFVDKGGILITDGLNISSKGKYIVYVDDKKVDLSLMKNDTVNGIAYLKTAESKEAIFKPIFKEAVISSPESLKLGQSVVVLGGVESTEVLTGIVSGFTKDIIQSSEDTASSTDPVKDDNFLILDIKTNISPTHILSGAPVINLKGEVIGINLDSGSSSFVPIDFIKSDLENILNSELVSNID